MPMYENPGKYSESNNHATHVVMVVYVLFELVEEPGEMPSLHARLRNSDLRATRWTRSDARLLAAVTESLVSAYTRHSVDTMERLQVHPCLLHQARRWWIHCVNDWDTLKNQHVDFHFYNSLLLSVSRVGTSGSHTVTFPKAILSSEFRAIALSWNSAGI